MRVNTRHINSTRGTSSYLWWSLCILCLHPSQVPRTSGGVSVSCVYTQACASYLWWSLCILCLHPGQCFVSLVEFMYLVFTPRPVPRSSDGVYVSWVYTQASASYLWWSLCILCLHPGQCLVPLVEFMYLVMPGESYRRQLRSLLLYLCYVFRALINSRVSQCCLTDCLALDEQLYAEVQFTTWTVSTCAY